MKRKSEQNSVHENSKIDEKHRLQVGFKASVVGISTNFCLFIFKLIVGIFASSISIISDAFNNLSDLLSSVINLVSFKIAAKPADKEHPYGHERVEYIAGLIISLIIIMGGAMLSYSSISNLISQESKSNFSIYSFIILGASVFTKICLGIYYQIRGKMINSFSLKASALDSFSDSAVTSLVLVASLVQYFYPNLWFLDGTMSLIVSLIVLIGGLKLIKEIISPLIGNSFDYELSRKIKEEVLKEDKILGVHDMLFHSYGPKKTYMSLHIEVPASMSLIESHEIADKAEKAIKSHFGIEATAHVDPVDNTSTEYINLKNNLTEFLQNIDASLTFHDLRVIHAPTKKVLFDLATSSKYSVDEKTKIAKLIRDFLKQSDPKTVVIITFDDFYLG